MDSRRRERVKEDMKRGRQKEERNGGKKKWMTGKNRGKKEKKIRDETENLAKDEQKGRWERS